MPESRQELELQLRDFQLEKTTNEEAIRHTLKLLKKADKRLLDNPAEKSKWGRTLDNLEATLSEKKRLLTMSETNIQLISRKLEQVDYAFNGADEQAVEESPAADSVDEPEPLAVPENLLSTI